MGEGEALRTRERKRGPGPARPPRPQRRTAGPGNDGQRPKSKVSGVGQAHYHNLVNHIWNFIPGGSLMSAP